MGNFIVGQSGGPSSVINSSLAGAFCAARDLGVDKIYGMRYGIQGFLKGMYVDLKEQITCDRDVEILKRTPAAFLGSCRYKLPAIEGNDEVYQNIFKKIDELDIEVFCYNGGNDSMDTINKLNEYAKKIGWTKTKFMGIPKTIDNDLEFTDHTPGFGSAAKFIATMLKEVITDGNALGFSKQQVIIMEIMGRNAGWLTAAAALSKDSECEGPDLIYLPEVTFDLDAFKAKMKGLLEKKDVVVVAVSEGVKLADGRFVCELGSASDFVDAFGHKQLSGTASALSDIVSSEFGVKTRAIERSTLQRCAAHISSKQDVTEAFACGYAAVKAGYAGETGKMILIDRLSKKGEPYAFGLSSHNISEIANAEKKVPLEWITEDGTYVSKEFISYARPLIEGELPPIMVNGIPSILKIK